MSSVDEHPGIEGLSEERRKPQDSLGMAEMILVYKKKILFLYFKTKVYMVFEGGRAVLQYIQMFH